MASRTLRLMNERQIQAIHHLKEKGKITNREYQELNHVSKPTATRDLTILVGKGILRRVGKGKREVHYVLNEPKMSQK